LINSTNNTETPPSTVTFLLVLLKLCSSPEHAHTIYEYFDKEFVEFTTTNPYSSNFDEITNPKFQSKYNIVTNFTTFKSDVTTIRNLYHYCIVHNIKVMTKSIILSINRKTLNTTNQQERLMNTSQQKPTHTRRKTMKLHYTSNYSVKFSLKLRLRSNYTSNKFIIFYNTSDDDLEKFYNKLQHVPPPNNTKNDTILPFTN